MKSVLTFGLIFSSIVSFGQDTTRLSLLFLGDIMQHGSQINDAWDPDTRKYNYDPCFKYVKPYTQSVDLAIGNLELTLAGPPYKGYPQFSAPDELLFALKAMGMDVLVTANNHCVDTGKKGLERTIMMLDSLGIPHTGTFVDEVSRLNEHPLLLEKNGFRLALLNYTYGTNGLPVTAPNIVNRIDTAAIHQDLIHARSLRPDAIIVFTHWGSEYQSLPNAWQKTVTEHAFKNGAQLVIGAHPHVLQPMEWRKEKNQLIAYSLGNFVSGQRKRYTDGGAMITLDLEKIAFGQDSSMTMITNPKYVLEWVYQQGGKNYFVLPAPVVERDTTGIIHEQTAKDAFDVFVTDSRALFGKHNKNILERKDVPDDSLITYKIEWAIVGKDSAENVTLAASIPYQVEIDYDSAGNKHYYSGEFHDLPSAEKYRQRLIANHGMSKAVIVRFVDGRRED